MKKGYVYYIRNTVTGKWYIGSTTRKARLNDHRKALRDNTHWNNHLQRAWNKYGKDSFLMGIEKEFECDEKARDFEKAILDEFVGKDECYNQCKSRYGNKWEQSTYDKLQANARENGLKGYQSAIEKYGHDEYKKMQSSWGKKGAMKKSPTVHTQETKDKLSKINTGIKRKLSPEGKQRLRESLAKARQKRWTQT